MCHACPPPREGGSERRPHPQAVHASPPGPPPRPAWPGPSCWLPLSVGSLPRLSPPQAWGARSTGGAFWNPRAWRPLTSPVSPTSARTPRKAGLGFLPWTGEPWGRPLGHQPRCLSLAQCDLRAAQGQVLVTPVSRTWLLGSRGPARGPLQIRAPLRVQPGGLTWRREDVGPGAGPSECEHVLRWLFPPLGAASGLPPALRLRLGRGEGMGAVPEGLPLGLSGKLQRGSAWARVQAASS